MKLDPMDDGELLYILTCNYSFLNKPDLNLDYLEQAIKSKPENKNLAREDSHFNNVRTLSRFKYLIKS